MCRLEYGQLPPCSFRRAASARLLSFALPIHQGRLQKILQNRRNLGLRVIQVDKLDFCFSLFDSESPLQLKRKRFPTITKAAMADAAFEEAFVVWAASGVDALPDILKDLLSSASATAAPQGLKNEHDEGAPAPGDVQSGTDAPDEPMGTRSEGDTSRISAIYFAMVWAVVTNKAKPSRVADTLAAQPPPSHPAHQPALCTALVDAIWLSGVRVEGGFGLLGESTPQGSGAGAPASPGYLATPEWARLCALVKDILARRMCVNAGVAPGDVSLLRLQLLCHLHPCSLTKRAVQERLELDMLESIGVIPQAYAARMNLVKLNTRDHFTQTKYNMFAEVSEVRPGVPAPLRACLTDPRAPICSRCRATRSC